MSRVHVCLTLLSLAVASPASDLSCPSGETCSVQPSAPEPEQLVADAALDEVSMLQLSTDMSTLSNERLAADVAEQPARFNVSAAFSQLDGMLNEERAQGDPTLPSDNGAKDLRLGVLFTYTSPEFGNADFARASMELANLWADRHNYMVFVEEYFDKSRPPTWSRVPAIKKYLPKVDVLMYLDLDVFIIDMDKSAEELFPMKRSHCSHSGKAMYDAELAKAEDEIFAWFARGYLDHFDDKIVDIAEFFANGTIPICDGTMAFRNTPRAFQFLDDVWDVFNTGQAFRTFPWEQYAFGYVVSGSTDYLKRICVPSEERFSWIGLESPKIFKKVLNHKPPFMIHATGRLGRDAYSESQLRIRRSEMALRACRQVSETEGVPLVCRSSGFDNTRIDSLPLAWLHIPKTGTSLANAILNLPGVCPGLPAHIDVSEFSSARVNCNVCEGTSALNATDPIPQMDSTSEFCSAFCREKRGRQLVGHQFMKYFSYFAYPNWVTDCPGTRNLDHAYSIFSRHAAVEPHYDDFYNGHGVTMLRHPSGRIISQYQHDLCESRLDENEWPLPRYAQSSSGCYARTLTRAVEMSERGWDLCEPQALSGIDPTPISRGEIDEAKRRLRTFVFVGITDDWARSVCLWSATFKVPCEASYFTNTRPHATAGRDPNSCRAKSLDLEGFVDEGDLEIYEFAAELFENRSKAYGADAAFCSSCYVAAGLA